MATLGVIFPGQGSQTCGMGVDLARHYRTVQECFERASAVLGYDLLALCETGSEEQLRETRVSQPAIFTTNVAIYRAVESLGFIPVVSAGHSFGEYCSLNLAGSLGFEEALRLVIKRALAMGEAADMTPGAMAAIMGFDEEQVEVLCAKVRSAGGGRVQIANLNAPVQIVVSGDSAAVDKVCRTAKAEGAKRVVNLNVSGAWHSELMQPAVGRFEPFVKAARIAVPDVAVISNVDVREYKQAEHIRRNLVASLCARVRWHETAVAVAARKADAIVECGAVAVLAPMMRRLGGVPPDRVIHVGNRAAMDQLARSPIALQDLSTT